MIREIQPAWLLRQAHELAGRKAGPGAPRNADLRRAVSDAYYACFHAFVLMAVEHNAGQLPRAEQLALCRRYRHAEVEKACRWLTGASGAGHFAAVVAPASADPEVQSIAQAFLDLKEAREQADYDHLADFRRATVLALVEQAEVAVSAMQTLGGRSRARLSALVTLLT